MEDGFYEWVFNSESFMEVYVLLLFLPMDGNVDKAELEAFSAELYQLASPKIFLLRKFWIGRDPPPLFGGKFRKNSVFDEKNQYFMIKPFWNR